MLVFLWSLAGLATLPSARTAFYAGLIVAWVLRAATWVLLVPVWRAGDDVMGRARVLGGLVRVAGPSLPAALGPDLVRPAHSVLLDRAGILPESLYSSDSPG